MVDVPGEDSSEGVAPSVVSSVKVCLKDKFDGVYVAEGWLVLSLRFGETGVWTDPEEP